MVKLKQALALIADIEALVSEHYDPDADVADESIEDDMAHQNGLILQLCRKLRGVLAGEDTE